MSYWSFRTRAGNFAIVELARGGVDLYFNDLNLGHYRSAMMAADDAGGGHHPTLSCYPDDGESLGVSRDISEWVYVRR